MKRIFLLLLIAILSTNLIFAEENTSNTSKNSKLLKTGNDHFAIKTQGVMGFYVDIHSNMSAAMPSAPTGLMLGVEFPSTQQRPWQQYLMNPTDDNIKLVRESLHIHQECLGFKYWIVKNHPKLSKTFDSDIVWHKQ